MVDITCILLADLLYMVSEMDSLTTMHLQCVYIHENVSSGSLQVNKSKAGLWIRIRIRIFLIGSWKFYRIRILSVLWLCRYTCINKGKIFKNRAFTHFQVNFSIFSGKKKSSFKYQKKSD